MPHPRSPQTFLPVRDYPFEDWRQRRRQALKAIGEVAVTYSVSDICDMTVEVAIWH